MIHMLTCSSVDLSKEEAEALSGKLSDVWLLRLQQKLRVQAVDILDVSQHVSP